MHAIGIDIGGTKIAGGVVDTEGTILAEDRIPTPTSSPLALEDAVVAMVERLRSDHEIGAVGVVAPGFVDVSQSTVYYAPNLSLRNEPMRQRLSERIDRPIVIDNDANAAGWAEFRFGVAQLSSDMVMLTIGTGVGGAIVADDRLFRGGFGVAGELGHMRMVPGGLPCGCGAHGCLEQYGSGRALMRMANALADAGGIGQALAEARVEAGELNGAIVASLIEADDPGALAALRELGDWLGQACATFSAVLDPQLFVFGGGVAQAGERLLDPIRRAYRQHMPANGYRPEAGFAIAELVNDAGLVGAADLARSHAERAEV